MLVNKIKEILPSCCEVGFINLSDCSSKEQVLVKEFFSETKTIIVLFHHVKTSLEWVWYPHEAERNSNTCGADLHSKNTINNIAHYLKDEGYVSGIVPYPGKCGLRMKDFAEKTELGEIGDNYLFLHKEWGPWVHLRLLLTDAQFEVKPAVKSNVCIHCGMCVSACPAHAIKTDTFAGIACNNYQLAQNNYVIDNYSWKCEFCA
jgi:epoxyqueuosine reductase QueG